VVLEHLVPHGSGHAPPRQVDPRTAPYH
jgi:hypothetical protein